MFSLACDNAHRTTPIAVSIFLLPSSRMLSPKSLQVTCKTTPLSEPAAPLLMIRSTSLPCQTISGQYCCMDGEFHEVVLRAPFSCRLRCGVTLGRRRLLGPDAPANQRSPTLGRWHKGNMYLIIANNYISLWYPCKRRQFSCVHIHSSSSHRSQLRIGIRSSTWLTNNWTSRPKMLGPKL